ncbi:basic proline-rich protein-like [Lutra lutra]|uniref:basic proline-rich protein-like n=1 Tax=Lutra lutra TaxID=9657 RepID=UPI001FD206BF|nr:basic proline-rich protein-like [Lutra lutra]
MNLKDMMGPQHPAPPARKKPQEASGPKFAALQSLCGLAVSPRPPPRNASERVPDGPPLSPGRAPGPAQTPPCPPAPGDAAPRHLPAGGAAGVPARCCSAAARALAGLRAGQGALVTPPPERPSGLRGRPPRSPRPEPRPLPPRPRSSPAQPARLPLGPGDDPPRTPAPGRRKVAGRGAAHQPRAGLAGLLRLPKLKIENDPSEGKGSRSFVSALKFPGMMLNSYCGIAISVPLNWNRHDSCFGSRAKK